jgi:hypothetical protein
LPENWLAAATARTTIHDATVKTMNQVKKATLVIAGKRMSVVLTIRLACMKHARADSQSGQNRQ